MPKAILPRSGSRGPFTVALIGAISIHLGAVVFARRSPQVPFAAPLAGETIVDVFDDPPDSALPEPDIPLPPEPPRIVDDAIFHEIAPARIPKSSPQPPRPVRAPGGVPRGSANANPRAFALVAPRPVYPYEARRRNLMGSGVATLTIDSPTGLVTGVTMKPTIGQPVLDQAALSAFKRWRFRPGTISRVRIPITFTLAGASY